MRAAYSSGVIGRVVGQGVGNVGERDHLDVGPVLGAEVALEPLPAQHHRAGAVAGGLQPVGDARGLRSETTKRILPSGSVTAWALVSEVWWVS